MQMQNARMKKCKNEIRCMSIQMVTASLDEQMLNLNEKSKSMEKICARMNSKDIVEGSRS
jgi:hypothetical protein